METPRPPLAKPSTRLPPPPPPPSSTTSPSHDFSFTISLHPPLPSPPPPPAAIDLAPADDIFLHGHLLPLDILSVARFSADSDMSRRRGPFDRVGSDLSDIKYVKTSKHHPSTSSNSGKEKAKHKPSPFSFGLGMWRRENNTNTSSSNMEDKAEGKKKGKKRGLDIGHLVKKYAAMVEQLFFFSWGERERRELRRRPHSFSGRSNPRERERWRQRRGQLSSAPASLRTSPANSGHLSVGGSVKLSTSSDESTMEELQSAIQAAIAHCKNSISVANQAGEKCKC